MSHNRRKLPAANQPSMYDGQPEKKARGKKRIAATTVEAYRKIAASLPRRQKQVAEGLSAWMEANAAKPYPLNLPTSYELFHFLYGQGKAFDISGVRSVLTGLRDADFIEAPTARQCSVTGERVRVWRPKFDHDVRSSTNVVSSVHIERGDIRIGGCESIESSPLGGVELEKFNRDEWNRHHLSALVWYRGRLSNAWEGPLQTLGAATLVAGRAVVGVQGKSSAVPICYLVPVGVAGASLDTPPERNPNPEGTAPRS